MHCSTTLRQDQSQGHASDNGAACKIAADGRVVRRDRVIARVRIPSSTHQNQLTVCMAVVSREPKMWMLGHCLRKCQPIGYQAIGVTSSTYGSIARRHRAADRRRRCRSRSSCRRGRRTRRLGGGRSNGRSLDRQKSHGADELPAVLASPTVIFAEAELIYNPP